MSADGAMALCYDWGNQTRIKKEHMQGWFRENKSRLLAYSSLTALGATTLAAVAVAGVSPLVPFVAAIPIFAYKFLVPTMARAETAAIKGLLSSGVFLRHSDPLHQRVAGMAVKMGISAPRVVVTGSSINNIVPASALLMSRWHNNKAMVFLPAHLYQSTFEGRPAYFTQEEQDAVLVHEMAHIKARDSYRGAASAYAGLCLKMAVFVSVASAFFGAMPLAAASSLVLLYMAGDLVGKYAGRRMEDACDEAAVRYTGNPDAMVSALRKLNRLFRHQRAFAENAQDISAGRADVADILTYAPKKDMKPSSLSRASAEWQGNLAEIFNTHPVQKNREDNIYRYARILGIESLRLLDEPEDTDFPRTKEGYILPPFAVGESACINPITGDVSVITALPAFNRVARVAQIRRNRMSGIDPLSGIDPSGPS